MIGDGGGSARGDWLDSAFWHVAGAAGSGPVAYDGSRAYFLTKTHGAVAVDVATGQKAWETTFGGLGATTYGFAGCAMSNTVVVCGDDDLVGLRPSDGTLLWRFKPTIGYSPGVFVPAVVGTAVITGSPSGTLYAVEGATGALRWTVRPFPADTGLISIFEPVSDGSTVFAAYTKFARPVGGGVIAIDALTGVIKWTAPFPASTRPGIDARGRGTTLTPSLVIAGSGDGQLYALNKTDGTVSWTLPAVGTAPPGVGGGIWGEDTRIQVATSTRLISASSSSWIIGFDLATRNELWRVTADQGGINTAPIVADGVATYVIHTNGRLIAYSMTDGHVLWRAGTIDRQVHGTVTLVGDRILAAADDGFYALRRSP